MLHVGYLPATVEEVYFPQAELVGDIGPSLELLVTGSRASCLMRAHCCRYVRVFSATSPSGRRSTVSR